MSRDEDTIAGFGDEWSRFDQSGVNEADLHRLFDAYFKSFPWEKIPDDGVGADIGCGSGRWADFVAPRVKWLICIDPSSQALRVARRRLAHRRNIQFVEAAAGELPIPDKSLDFAYSIGVLHHTPAPLTAMRDCVTKLKPGAPFLVYLYYAFDNRPAWFRLVWRISEIGRRFVSRRPMSVRYWLSQILACVVYWPLARGAKLLEERGRDVSSLPLAAYRDRPFYMMRNDSLDRFGTRLEHRYTAQQVERLMHAAGLVEVEVDPDFPYWCAVGRAPLLDCGQQHLEVAQRNRVD